MIEDNIIKEGEPAPLAKNIYSETLVLKVRQSDDGKKVVSVVKRVEDGWGYEEEEIAGPMIIDDEEEFDVGLITHLGQRMNSRGGTRPEITELELYEDY